MAALAFSLAILEISLPISDKLLTHDSLTDLPVSLVVSTALTDEPYRASLVAAPALAVAVLAELKPVIVASLALCPYKVAYSAKYAALRAACFFMSSVKDSSLSGLASLIMHFSANFL